MATWSPTSTRLRVLPQAVRSSAAEDIMRAADMAMGLAERRRAERLAAEAAQAQRAHEAQMQADRLIAQRELQQIADDAASGRLSAQFRHNVEMLGRTHANRMAELERTFGFQGAQNEAERALRWSLFQGQDATTRRGQDLSHDIARRRLSLDAISTGAAAQELGARLRGMGATGPAPGDWNQAAKILFPWGMSYDDPQRLNEEIDALQLFGTRVWGLGGAPAFGPARAPATGAGQVVDGAEGRMTAPEGAGAPVDMSAFIPRPGQGGLPALGGINMSNISADVAIRALELAKGPAERQQIIDGLSEDVRREVLRRMRDR